MDRSVARAYFERPDVVQHYARATANVGLWESEERIFARVFKKDHSLLDLGTGTGRIALGLYELGYKHILGADQSRPMIVEARRINQLLGYGVSFQVEDATRLSFADGLFEGIVFGFNGLMQIPTREARRQALAQIKRVLAPGGYFVFTSHDREMSRHQKFWHKEKRRWDRGEQQPELDDFGDRFEPTPLGELYIHIPTQAELRDDLKSSGWKIEACVARSTIATESMPVREFSDECLFWVVR